MIKEMEKKLDQFNAVEEKPDPKNAKDPESVIDPKYDPRAESESDRSRSYDSQNSDDDGILSKSGRGSIGYKKRKDAHARNTADHQHDFMPKHTWQRVQDEEQERIHKHWQELFQKPIQPYDLADSESMLLDEKPDL